MWRCAFCETNNGDQDNYCSVCGSARAASEQLEHGAYQSHENEPSEQYDDGQWQQPASEYIPDEPYDRAAKYDGSYAAGGTVVRHRRKWPWLVAALAVIIIAAGGGVLALENMYGDAVDARARGEYKLAYEKFSAIEWYRDSAGQAEYCDAAAHIAAGDILMARQEFAAARGEYAQAANAEGDELIVETWVREAAQYSDNGDYETAASVLEPVSRTDAGCAALYDIYMQQAGVLLQNDDTDGAAAAYEEAAAYAADDADLNAAQNGVAVAAVRAEELRQAEEARKQEEARIAAEQAEKERLAKVDEMYRNAGIKAENGDLSGAIADYMQLDGYSDSAAHMRRLSVELCKLAAAGGMHYIQIDDGKAVAYGNDFYGQCNVQGANDAIQAAAGKYHSVILYADGTVVAAGDNSYGQCAVQDWTGIVAVAAGSYHTVGLRYDGSVVTAGWDAYGQRGTRTWTDIVAVAAGERHTVGLRADGSVVAAGDSSDGRCRVNDWRDIVQIACGYGHTVGLKSDGSVVATGWKEYGQTDVQGAQEVICIAAGAYHTVCLQADGTIYACGNDFYGQCSVQTPGAVAVIADGAYTLCMDGEGNITRFGALYEQCGPGSAAAEVRMLQQTLKVMGYYGGAVNGNYSDELAAAVAAAEKAMGMEPDGKADPEFLESIY
ncbi:MAG: peptidoglycan-binding protein [Clostridia bacterium]|nr:peptidoglycan-binding protein [Clostridia bacterium]